MATMQDLQFFGLDEKQIRTLTTAYGPNLLPLQEKALKQGLLTGSEGLMVCAPTSSGKTLLAELAFLAEAKHDRPVILLVPSKALASERYNRLKSRYDPLGYRICLSSRDHSEEDRSIAEGRYHLAVIVYEKMWGLLLRHPGLVSSVRVIVIDELQYIADPDRGPDLELLLTRLRSVKEIRFLGLSAVSSSEILAQWLGCRSVVETARPVELRQGVLCGNRFLYREHNSGREGEEHFPLPEVDNESVLMLEAAKHFAAQGESSILFWPSRKVCYEAAHRLAAMGLPKEIDKVPSVLTDLPNGRMRQSLLDLAPYRIGVHTSDLSPEERAAVEQLAFDGTIRILCATSTLAEGINLPAQNVLAHPLSYRAPLPDQAPEIQKLEPQRFLNMIGRAGRLGLASFGRGMVVTTLEGDIDGFLDRYLSRRTYELTSQLPQRPLRDILMERVASSEATTVSAVTDWLQETFAGRERAWHGDLQNAVTDSVETLVKKGLLSRSGDRLYLSGVVGTAARWGIAIETATALHNVLARLVDTGPQPHLLLHTICRSKEIEEIFVPLRRSEWIGRMWSRRLWENDPIPESDLSGQTVQAEERAAKKTLILDAWSSGEKMLRIESGFEVLAGVVRSLADQASWLLEPALEIAAEMGAPPELCRRLDELRGCVITGLPRKGFAWKSLLARGFPREFALDLIDLGADQPEAVASLPEAEVNRAVPESWRNLLPKNGKDNKSKRDSLRESAVSLYIDPHRPDRVILDGAPVSLTQKQYGLLAFLAARPGECVSYDMLLDRVWEGTIVEQAQVPKIKSQICKRFREVLGPRGDGVIKTISGRGLILQANAEILAGRGE
ncbi:MAG TPA: DEAD/DEAH box helicase [bacterium]|nr:DEAD/DEAH box helicase [bacterium]